MASKARRSHGAEPTDQEMGPREDSSGAGRQWSWAAAAIDSGAEAGSRTPTARVRVQVPAVAASGGQVRDRVSARRRRD